MTNDPLDAGIETSESLPRRRDVQPKPFGGLWSGLCHSRLVGRLRPRRSRRILVSSSFLVLFAIPVVGWLTGSLGWMALLLIPYLGSNILLAAATNGLMERRMSSLDERERMIRLTIFREPYVVGVTIGLLAGSVGFTVLRLDEAWATGVMLAMYTSAYLIPTSVLAWKLPDEARDEE